MCLVIKRINTMYIKTSSQSLLNPLVHYLSLVLLVVVFLAAAIAAAAWTVLYHVSRLSFEIVGELHLTYGTANLLTEALIIAGLGFVVRSLPNKNVGVLLGSRGL